LAEALDQGLPVRRVRRTARTLKRQPDLSVADLLAMLHTDTPNRYRPDPLAVLPIQMESQTDTDSRQKISAPDTQVPDLPDPPIQTDTLSALTDLLQVCFPDMGDAPAEALAKAPNMAPVRKLLFASQICLNDPASRSDIHMIILVGLIQKFTHQLDTLITTNPSYLRALQNSGVRWKSPKSDQIP